MAISAGRFLAPLSSVRRHETRLARAQRSLSRIANTRRDYLHQATTAISQRMRQCITRATWLREWGGGVRAGAVAGARRQTSAGRRG